MRLVVVLCMSLFCIISCDTIVGKHGNASYYYKVTGTATSVTISANESAIDGLVTSLPWQSEEWTKHVDDETSILCAITAVNTTTNNATVTVEIYVDGDLKATDTATGPNCMAYADYTVDDENL